MIMFYYHPQDKTLKTVLMVSLVKSNKLLKTKQKGKKENLMKIFSIPLQKN